MFSLLKQVDAGAEPGSSRPVSYSAARSTMGISKLQMAAQAPGVHRMG